MHPAPTRATFAVEVHGSCFAGRSVIQELLQQKNRSGLVTLRGCYSLAVRHDGGVTLAGSSVGAPNLFYVQQGSTLLYGTSVIDLVRRAGLPWRWNWRALADLTALEHCVAGETLHADVKKLLPGMVVRMGSGGLSTFQMPWIERIPPNDSSPRGAVDALVESCRLYAEGDVVVSMSAGFDSRLLLACLLASGNKPRLITMGAASSTDARVSEAIARRLGLRIDVVPLQAENYFASARAVLRLTSGTKSFQHWHTYAYAKNAPLNPDSRIFIGSNGEAARSYYLDKGTAGQLADQLPSQLLLRKFWEMKLRPIVSSADLALLHPELASQLSEPGLAKRRERIASLAPGSLLESLDRFYTEQRVAHFIANGLALVNAHATPAVPMLERAWMSQVWNLPRRWKMDSKWHRYAIHQLCPDLLEFQEEKTGLPMRANPRPFYWLPSRAGARSVPYVNYEQLLRSDGVLQMAEENAELIEPVAQPALIREVFGRHQRGENLSRLASFLLTMLYLSRSLREAGIDQPGLAASTMSV